MARLSASRLRTSGHPLEPKKGHHHHQPTAAPPETGEVKKKPQTPGVPLEESKGSILKLPLGREGAFKA